jgi:hypothetical protein
VKKLPSHIRQAIQDLIKDEAGASYRLLDGLLSLSSRDVEITELGETQLRLCEAGKLKSSKIETKLANIGVRAGHISSNATLKERPYDQSILEAKMKTNTTLAGWYSSTA